ncbi:MAG: HAMP domain-containing protein [Alphaproteobacteria bacterium]|uniref:histidine kinase n=1 Tax=Candidatus Nitrobium versatile TaxID=2884831 RepID=A0A953JAL8_9BACT|nr:HAMP domain-containing protein [Candidatus Nitrobium versatile]
MLRKSSFIFSLNKKLIFMMLFLSFILISILLFFYSQSEQALFRALERQTAELTKAIQIGVEEVTGSGSTDEARLSKYLKELNANGVKEISIISNADEIVASTNPSKIGQAMTHKKKELIIRAELGEPVSEEGRAYNVIIPVIAGGTQYGYVHLKVNKDDFSDLLKRNAINRIAATAFVFGVGILTIIFLSRSYTRPIRNVVDAAMRVAAGDLRQNIPVKSRDEIGQLSESFNFMVRKLREARDLEERLREAEHLSGLGQLSRSMAHEIRNPLNFINLSIGYLGDKYITEDPSKQEKFNNLISGIKMEIQRLNNLVNEFLDYSRPIKLKIQRVRIDTLLEDVMALIWAKAEADGIRIVREYSVDAELSVDPDLFKSCVLNMITNAFHAMGQAGRPGVLKVRTGTAGDEFVLSVEDNGIGVAQENREKIFEPFFSTRQNGLGLGLPMTKRVMEEHGGRIVFASVAGEGSEVQLWLPLRVNEEQQVEGNAK